MGFPSARGLVGIQRTLRQRGERDLETSTFLGASGYSGENSRGRGGGGGGGGGGLVRESVSLSFTSGVLTRV